MFLVQLVTHVPYLNARGRGEYQGSRQPLEGLTRPRIYPDNLRPFQVSHFREFKKFETLILTRASGKQGIHDGVADAGRLRLFSNKSSKRGWGRAASDRFRTWTLGSSCTE